MSGSATNEGISPGSGDGTRAARAGLPEPVKYEPTLPGPVFAAHFHLPGEPTGPYTYGRDENPTWTHGAGVHLNTYRSRSAAGSEVLPIVARSEVEPAATVTGYC